MEKRLLLAIVLSTLVLGVFSYYFERQRPSMPPTQPLAAALPPSTAPAPVANNLSAPAPDMVSSVSAPKLLVYIDAPLYHAILSNVGAVPISWQLKNYKADAEGRLKGKTGGDDFEMIPQFLRPDDLRPYFLTTGDANLDREINFQPYEIRGGKPLTSDARLSAPATLTLVYQRTGLYVEKTFSFKSENYLLEVKPRVVVEGKDRPCHLMLGPSVGDHPPNAGDPRTIPHMVVEYARKSIDRKPGEKLDREYPYGDAHGFAGVEIQYFASVFLPPTPQEVRFQKFYYKDPAPSAKESVPNLVLALFRVGDTPILTFMGPKDYDTLDRISSDMTRLIDYGWFAPIVKPLLITLKGLYKFVHNFGVAIIILTLLITLALFPLRYKQLVSMKRMQKVQPKVKAIQEKYKKIKNADVQQRQDMQKEIMEVYSHHGVNPLGGCWPMLPQLPIFFAFNSMLSYSIELRNAPFFGWIQDLSTKDPYYVAPVLMGLTMFIQQKMTPSTSGDPTQDKMMLIMPLMMTVFFANLSSGLTLYFLFSNIFGIILQKVCEHWIPSDTEERRTGSQRVPVVRR